MSTNRNILVHILAFAIVCVWGTTFVSSKVLINNGLRPADVFFCRFLLAYIFIWFVTPRKLFADSLKDEILLMLLGVTGGSLYFQAENTALIYTSVTNVSLIVCTTPILTSVVMSLTKGGEHLTRRQVFGTLIAFAGMAMVVLNGHFALKLSPLGDLLAFAAAWSWAFYSVITKRLNNKYRNLFIIRKVFFYGLMTILPVFLWTGIMTDISILLKPQVIFNLIFLGMLASLACFVFWNVVMDRIGVLVASNYLYLNPVVAIITASVIINERITLFAIAGTILILFGLYRASTKKANKA